MEVYYVDSINTVNYGTTIDGCFCKDIINLKKSHLDEYSIIYPIKEEMIVTKDDNDNYKYHPSLKKEFHDIEFVCNDITGI